MMSKKASEDIRREYVSTEEMIEVHAVFSQDPVCQGAFGMLQKLLFARGAEVTTPGFAALLNLSRPLFRHYVHHHFTNFLSQAFRHLICFGFFVWTEIEAKLPDPIFKDKPVRHPIILDPGLYNVNIVTRHNFQVEYEIYSVRQGQPVDKPDPTLRIYFYPDKEPDPSNGRLRGPLSSIVPHSKEMAQMFELMMRAEHQRTHPPYTLQTRKETVDQLGEIQVQSTEPAVLGEDLHIQTFKYQHAVRQLESAKFQATQSRPESSHLRRNVYLRQHVGAAPEPIHSTVEDHTVVLPPTLESCPQQPPMPEARPDILLFEQQRQNHIMFLLGIPLSLGINTASKTFTRENIGDNDFVAFSRTLKMYQKLVLRVGQVVLQEMFWTKELGVVLSLPLIPFTDINTLLALFNQDIIHFEALKKHAIELAGLEEDDMATEPNIHLRPPERGSENTTTAMMKKKEDALKSDAELNRAKAKQAMAQGESQVQIAKEQRKLEEKKLTAELDKLDKQMQLEEMKFRHQIQILKKKPAATKK